MTTNIRSTRIKAGDVNRSGKSTYYLLECLACGDRETTAVKVGETGRMRGRWIRIWKQQHEGKHDSTVTQVRR